MKKKVLLVSCKGLGNGGVQAVMMSIVRRLSNKYIFDIVLFTENKGHYEDEFLKYGGTIFRICHSRKNKFQRIIDGLFCGNRLYKELLNYIRANGPYCAIHCNNYCEGAFCLKAAAKYNIPVRICHTHTIVNTRGLLQNIYLRIIKKYATTLVGCSREACASTYGEQSDSLVVVNPYDEHKFLPDVNVFGQPREMVLMQIGNFSENKNQMFSVRVLAEIKKQYPNAKLNLVGFNVGDYQSKLEKIIEEMGMEEDVKILPHNTNTAEYLEDSAAFIFPSIREGFGIVLIEAQAMGVKCYVSDTVPTVADRGGCVYLPLSDGPKAWADRIIEDYEACCGRHQFYDCSQFASHRIAEIFDRLYSGEKHENRSDNIS